MILRVQGAALNICPISRSITIMACFYSTTKEAAESRSSRKRCKKLSTVTSAVQHGVNGLGQLFCRRNLRCGSGVTLLMLMTWLDGRTGSLRSVAG